MPRPSLSRPPPITVPWEPTEDVENEPPTAYNVRRHGPTNRKLFFTPNQKTPSSPSPTFLLTRDSITRRYYKQHQDKTPMKTPLPRRPSHAPSTSRRPKITRLDATPSLNRTLQGSAPERWRVRQITDLTAWLNHELSAHSDAATLPLHQVASSVVFLNQFAAINSIYRSKNVHNVLARITNEILSGRLNVSKSIKLATFLKERDALISLLLLNYHPHWLLLALSVVLGMNLATDLDEAVEKAGTGGRSFNHEQVLMQALETAIRNEFLADAPSDNVASREQTSPAGQERDRYNALILRRTLVLIYLLDVAKRQRDPIIKPDPPLFRTTSEMTSSVDILRDLQKLLLNDHGDIVRFLSQRGYSVKYKSPVFEPFGSLRIVNLSEDMRDGTRLCKLASIMRRDHQILTQVIRIGPGHRPTMALAIKKQNVAIALNSMKECLPPNLHSRFQWHGTPHDIATGNVDKTIAVLWQIAALWMEYVVVDNHKLKEELEVVKDEFRVARRNPESPSNNVQIDLTSLADSPSKLQIIESCDTDSGDLLLMWCATLCGIYGVEIRDFTEDFRDGAVLCLILHHYCPELMRIDEINRIPAGDHRGAFAAEAEHKHVQKNLDLFMDRCRLLGTIPEIFLTAEATLAPAFRDSLKQESVGRVMQLLASYLFRRMMMQKDTTNARREVWEIMENHKGTPEMDAVQQVDPVRERETTPIGKVTVDTIYKENLQQAEEGSSENFLGSNNPATTDHRNDETEEAQSNSPSNNVSNGNNGDDLAHVYTRMRHVQPRRATRPRSSQLLADRERAARVILSHYRGYKARQKYTQLRNGIVDVQSAVRGYLARREFDQLREAYDKEVTQTAAMVGSEQDPSPAIIGSTEAPMQLADEPSITTNEYMRSLPLRIGQQILDFIPGFRRHVLAMESYSKRMLEHEKKEAEHQAAIVIQSAARTHLAQRTRNHVETQRHETRRTWMSCAAEAAKTALRLAENQRRELAKWHEQVLTNAIHQAGNRFNSEMSRAEATRKQEALQQQKLAEMKVSQEANFAAELHRQKMAFEEQMAAMQRGIQNLETRAASVELPPVSSTDVRQEEEVFGNISQSINANNAQEDALKLIFNDLNAERERADRFETELQNIRCREQEANMDILRLNNEWKQRFQSLEADIHQWHGTLLNGAICMATAEYRLHMDVLRTVRSQEEQETVAWEEALQKGIAAFDEEEREEGLLLNDILAKWDAHTHDLKEAVLAHEVLVAAAEQEEARVEQRQLATEANLDVLAEQSKKKDISWVSAVEEYDAEAEDILCLIEHNERAQQEDDRHNDNLDEEIQSFIAAEYRKDMEQRLTGILDAAEDRFYEEMSEREEENENNMYCRHEIDIQLEQEDQEEALDAEEFQQSIEKVSSEILVLEDARSELDEHLGLLDSYIDRLFSVSPSVMVCDDIPDVLGEDIMDGIDECTALYSRTCELMEQMCVDETDEEEQAERESRVSDRSLERSPESLKNVSVGASLEQLQVLRPSEGSRHEIEERDDLDSIDGLGTSSGLYQRLVEEEVEYYNGKTKHDIGVQTGSGPNSLASSPVHDSQAEIGTQYTSDAEAQPSEEEQSCTGYESEFSSIDNRASSLPGSQKEHDSSLYETSPRVVNGTQHSRDSFPYASMNTSPSRIYTPDEVQESLSGRALCAEKESRFVSSGPLDTLAQLALQDAMDANILEDRFDSGYEAQTSENPLHYSGEVYVPATEACGKENILDGSNLSASKNGGLKVYGLRMDSPLRTWNSPMSAQDGDAHKAGNVDVESTTAQIGSASPALHVVPGDLGDLSIELNAFNIQPHRQSVESVVQNPSSANKLESVMRRISIAASSPQVESKSKTTAEQDRQGPHCDIIRTIFTLIRYCSRSDKQLKLRELGISIIHDFCLLQHRIVEIMAAEECIDVLTTCVQYHRDQDTIFDPTVRVLWEIALRPDGKQMIVDSKASVARLQNVNELLVSQVVREQKNRDRIRQANMIVNIVRKRRIEGGSLKSMTEALRSARDQKVHSAVPMKDSHRLLGDLVEILS